jgi:hypothetical protein
VIIALGGGRSVSFAWNLHYKNVLDDAKLIVKFWDGLAPTAGKRYNHVAQEMRTWEFIFDWQPGGLIGWTGEERLFNTKDLVEHCLKQFVNDVQEYREQQE